MALAYGLTVFPTAIGWCGLAWGDQGLTGVQLPEADDRKTRARLSRRFPEAMDSPPPPEVRTVIDAIKALIRGASTDLTFAALDMEDLSEFNRRVYAIALTIAPGQTRTYGDIALQLGDRSAARAVGKALGENPFPIIVPCHRVLAAGGKIGGFSANGGVVTKVKLLAIERARTGDVPTLFDDVATISLAPPRQKT